MAFKFKVVCGSYVSSTGRKYKHGEVVESEIDLRKGVRNAFELINESDPEPEPLPVSRSRTVKNVTPPPVPAVTLGEDVTEYFPLAEKSQKIVRQSKDDLYWVYSTLEPSLALHPQGIKGRGKVNELLKKL